VLALAGAASAASLEIVSTSESPAGDLVTPCVRNNGSTAEPLSLAVGADGSALRYRYSLGELSPGRTSCYTLRLPGHGEATEPYRVEFR
jgi:hypothetical protein